MKFGVAILVIVALAGCSQHGVPPIPTGPSSPAASPTPTPPAPPAPTPRHALLWVMVINVYGGCIEGATIQIVGADGAGQPIPQQTPCDAWAYDGGVTLKDLTEGVEVRLRGAASSYASREVTFVPFPVPGWYQAVFITLSKAN